MGVYNMKNNIILFLLVCTIFLPCCKPKEQPSSPTQVEHNKPFSVLVYITGIVAGSPYYEMLVAGAQEFADAHNNVSIKIYEAGFNQAE
jgi:ABC-type glycerol-3-phosphate transport system substrate-binding protein